ncbi:MAG: GreA/GreB family elongation factor [Syntrophomonadaceae bacterium]|nr:GreA/GreB family elongation factor [Syntrophomonadaceae bacterium]
MQVTLSPAVFEHLVEQMARLQNERDDLVDRLYPHICRERIDFERQLDQYIQQIANLINSAKKSDKDDKTLPFVIVDSEVEVLDLNRQKSLKFQIVGPCPGQKSSGCISCLSPMGKSLLLRKVDDEVTVNAPAGTFVYRIESIQLCG